MKVHSKTDIGLVRKSNQDFVINKVFSNNIAWSIVCDGMGGAKAGDVASKIAATTISDFFDSSFSNPSPYNIRDIQLQSIQQANSSIFKASKENEDFSGMGTTAVICVVYDGYLHTSHVGDSRAYLIRNGTMSQLTTDHSVVQEMINNGEITENEAQNHPRKNLITKALGVYESVTCDYNKTKIQNNDIIMLCTDGLTNHLSPKEIQNVILGSPPQNAIDILINQAKNSGGKDNITVSIIEI